MMKKPLGWLAIIGVGAAAYWYVRHDGSADTAGVVREQVSVGDVVQTVPAIGTVTARRTVRVGSQVSGRVKALYVDFNSVVTKDQILAELDPSLLEVQVAVQEASLERQEVELAQQRLQLEDDRTNLARAQTQLENGLLSQQQLEAAELRVSMRAAQIAAAERQKMQTLAQLNQARLNVSYCTIRSPIDGVIVNRFIDVGQTVQASASTPNLFMIAADLTTVRIMAGVDEADITSIRTSLPATFTVSSYRDETFTGEVEAIRLNAQIQNNVVTYPVWITATNPDLRLRPSMTATMHIVIGAAENVVRVPNQALKFRMTPAMRGWFGLPAPAPGQARRVLGGTVDDAGLTAEADSRGSADDAPPERAADTIDGMFPTVAKRIRSGEVWVYDQAEPDASRRLRPFEVRLGFSDGQYTELVSGDLEPGTELVTAVVPPASVLSGPGGNIFGQPQRGRGGLTPGEPQGPTRLAPRGGGRGGGRGGD